MITIVENFISKQECKKFIKMVSHLKLPDDADFENEYKKLLNKERDRQLGQFSLFYFNRIKQRVKISEN